MTFFPPADPAFRDPRIESLTPSVLDAYARAAGWIPYPPPRAPLWHHPTFLDSDDGDPIELFVPRNNHAGDFAQRAYEMVRQLSQLEGRTEEHILADMVALLPTPATNGVAERKPKPRKRTPAK